MSIACLEEVLEVRRTDGDPVQANIDALRSLVSTSCPLSGAIIKGVYCQDTECQDDWDYPTCAARRELSYLGRTRRVLDEANTGVLKPQLQFHL
jgi:hypothetical protein